MLETWPIRSGTKTELADDGQISTTRMSQIMWLDNLAPDIQEAVLDLPRTVSGIGLRGRIMSRFLSDGKFDAVPVGLSVYDGKKFDEFSVDTKRSWKHSDTRQVRCRWSFTMET